MNSASLLDTEYLQWCVRLQMFVCCIYIDNGTNIHLSSFLLWVSRPSSGTRRGI